MSSLPIPPVEPGYRHRVQRSQWLSDLASALDRAERLTAILSEDPAAAVEAAALGARIALVRAALALVRSGRSREIDPNWLNIARKLAPLPGDGPTAAAESQTPSGTSPPPPKPSR